MHEIPLGGMIFEAMLKEQVLDEGPRNLVEDLADRSRDPLVFALQQPLRGLQYSRVLSHDERHAAEAAFAGRPFNPRWSARARAVYEGILKSLPSPPLTEEPLAPQLLAGDSIAETTASGPHADQPATARIPFEQALDNQIRTMKAAPDDEMPSGSMP